VPPGQTTDRAAPAGHRRRRHRRGSQAALGPQRLPLPWPGLLGDRREAASPRSGAPGAHHAGRLGAASAGNT